MFFEYQEKERERWNWNWNSGSQLKFIDESPPRRLLLLLKLNCSRFSYNSPPALPKSSSLSLILLFYCTIHKIFTSINVINISTEFLISIFRLFMGKMALLRRGNPAINNNSDSTVTWGIELNSILKLLASRRRNTNFEFMSFLEFPVAFNLLLLGWRRSVLTWFLITGNLKREHGEGGAVDRHLRKFILKLTPHFVYNNSLVELFIIPGRFIAFSTRRSEIIFLEGEFEWKFEIIFHKL